MGWWVLVVTVHNSDRCWYAQVLLVSLFAPKLYKRIAVASDAILKEMTSRSKKSRECRVVDEQCFCGHCNQHLALKMFRRHRKLFWDAEGDHWLIPGSGHQGKKYNYCDAFIVQYHNFLHGRLGWFTIRSYVTRAITVQYLIIISPNGNDPDNSDFGGSDEEDLISSTFLIILTQLEAATHKHAFCLVNRTC